MPYPSNVDPGYGILYFNVHDYGAVGDGFTDDSTAIQTCINASVKDSIIYFPPGNYRVGTTIQLLGWRTYLGTSSSSITMMDNANLIAVFASQDWLTNGTASGNPINITSLTIDGNYTNNTSGHGIVLMNYGSTIRECTIQNCFNNGIMLSSVNQSGANISNTCVENRLESCKVDTCLGYGIYCHDSAGKLIDGYIDSCIVTGATLDAIKVERGTGFFISKNYCYDNLSSCITVRNCYNTFIINNKIDDYGQDINGNDFIAGIDATIIGPRPTIISGNIIGTGEPAANYHYQHLTITFGGTTSTRCLVLGNIIRGGWDTNPNNPGSPAYSQAITYQVNGTQTGSGQPAYLTASGNNYSNTGNDVFLDSYITPEAIETVGDIKLDKHIVASNSLIGAPVLSALTDNGGSPPSPTFSSTGGTDVRGIARFGSGTSPSSGDQVSITFSNTYSNAPIVMITPQNSATEALGLYASSVSTTGFNIAAQNAPTASQSGTTYSAGFIVIG